VQGGRRLLQRLVRSHLIVLSTEYVKHTLLRQQIRLWRIERFCFQGPMHTLMHSILLRLRQFDPI
jgi:hypothetical protein